MSGPNLRLYYEFSFNPTDNVVQGNAICGPQCGILFPAEGIQKVGTFDGKPITYIPKKVVSHMKFRYFGEIIALKILICKKVFTASLNKHCQRLIEPRSKIDYALQMTGKIFIKSEISLSAKKLYTPDVAENEIKQFVKRLIFYPNSQYTSIC